MARQQNSQGGRGGQSGTQDLSALFDRELQRQQATNYEQRAGASQTSETRREDESLRRLRELAARQDELNRQQQELARRLSQLTTEEIKRRLERLTREQEELRRQADELAQRLQQQSAQGDAPQQEPRPGERSADASSSPAGSRGSGGQASGQSGGTPAGGQSAGVQRPPEGEGGDAQRVREAAREMAGAAGDLQRESPESASARSARALDRLRSAERALSGASPDARRRRAGGVQSEARQIAEAQRRLAGEASASSGDEESLRRLAGQQARLAERARHLEQAARELAAREGRGTPGDAVRRAVRDLSSARVAERLEAGADAARAAADQPGQSGAQAARQLAETAQAAAQPLERLANRMGEVSGQDAESRRLSEGLAQTRGLRERLAALERQAGASQPGAPPGRSGGRAGDRPEDPAQAAEPSQASQSSQGGGRDGRGQGESGGSGQGGTGSVAQMQEQLQRELRQRREPLDAMRRDSPDVSRAMGALEGWTPSLSAPGTEAWKQDRAQWDAAEAKRDAGARALRVVAGLTPRGARGAGAPRDRP